MQSIRLGWMKDVVWHYYMAGGGVREERGMYLICDNGYLRWPESICPYESADKTTLEGYFSTNLESMRKDVEYTFGILKKRWRILNNRLNYRDIRKCKKIFVACACLHNFLLDQMERTDVRVGRGYPIGDDGLWEGALHTFDNRMSLKFSAKSKSIGRCKDCSGPATRFYDCPKVPCNALNLLCANCAQGMSSQICSHPQRKYSNAELIG